jgi:hypothetical protein
MKKSLTTLAALAICGTAFAQAPAPKAQAASPAGDQELAMAALEGLMAQPSERALPIIKKVLAGSQPINIKKRALFVLSQLDSAEARQILVQTSRSADAAMRGEAIRAIGIGGESKSVEALQEVYASGSDDVKGDVLQAWLIADRKDLVLQSALNAKSDEEANRAIRTLGAMGATEELRKLGDRPNAASGLVEAYAISGDLASLRKIVDGNGARSVRVDAVRKIGIVNGEEARTALRDIYVRSADEDIKEAALQGMLIAGDDKGVLALYRASKSVEEKRALMRTLALMDGDAALEAIDAALEGKL